MEGLGPALVGRILASNFVLPDRNSLRQSATKSYTVTLAVIIKDQTMKHIYFFIISILFCANISAQEIKIEGKITGIDMAEINVLALPCKFGETPVWKKMQTEKGKFKESIVLKTNMWHVIKLRCIEFNSVFGEEKSSKQKLKNREIVFFAKPEEVISIIGNIGEFGINYHVFGNEINIQRNQAFDKLFPLEEEFNKLTISNENEKNKELENKINVVEQKLEKLRLISITEHPDWIYSAETLAGFPEDTIRKYFKSFTPDVQNSFFGIHLSKILNAAEIGSSAPKFTLLDEKDEKVLLSDFNGKFIVLEFWGTWCGYCLKGIPKMKKYYSKYHDQIEFIGIACRDNKQTWLKAIENYDLNWINLLAENEEITNKYGVEGYPTKVIIDKEGKIAFKSTGESDEFYEKMDEILTNNNR